MRRNDGQPRQYKPKVCMVCGHIFSPNSSFQKTCGPECRRARDNERERIRSARPEVKDQRRAADAIRNSRPEAKARKAVTNRAWYLGGDAKARKVLANMAKKGGGCCSTVGEVAAILLNSISAIDGLPCISAHHAYHLDHIHGGPAVGLIPAGLNQQLSEAYLATFDEAEAARWLAPAAVEYIKRRIELADILAGRIAWG